MSRPLLGTSASEIGIDRDDREPIQSQIARQIRALVLSGRLKPQTKLPSTRALSLTLSATEHSTRPWTLDKHTKVQLLQSLQPHAAAPTAPPSPPPFITVECVGPLPKRALPAAAVGE